MSAGPTRPVNMRLDPTTLARLDEIAEKLTARSGVPHSRTDAVRHAAVIALAAAIGREQAEEKAKKKPQ